MDILAGLKDKLRFIERHYAAASESFRETMRRIDAGEEPFEPPPFDPDNDDGEPPFLTQWQEADESLNIEGQAALKLVQSALHDYLSWYVKLSRMSPSSWKGKHWLERYKNHFLEAYGIDFAQAPVSQEHLEEVIMARNDLEHEGQPFGMTRVQSEEHQSRFPLGLFVHEIDRQIAQSSGEPWLGRIYVTRDNLAEAIRRVETFCEFLDGQRLF